MGSVVAKDETLTTGQIAKICNVAPRTVSKWVDKDLLKGYRLPGSRDRRVEVRNLVPFMQKHGIPLRDLRIFLVGPQVRVLIIDVDPDVYEIPKALIEKEEGYVVQTTKFGLMSSVVIQEFQPHVIFVNVDHVEKATEIKVFVKSNAATLMTKLIAMSKNASELGPEWVKSNNFDAVIGQPCQTKEMLQWIQEVMASLY